MLAISANAQIYSTDGVLSANRIVGLNGKTLHFKPVGTFSNGLFMSPTGEVGINTTAITPNVKLDVNGNVQALTGTFARTAPNGSSFPTNDDRVKACAAIQAGALVDPLSGSLGRTFNFYDFPISNMNSTPAVWFSIVDRANKDRLRFIANQGAGAQLALYDRNQVENFKVNEDGGDNVFLHMPKPNSRIVIGDV